MGIESDSEKVLRLSVRNLVEFIFRSGDIDNRRTKSADKEAMKAGSNLHRKIQRRMGTCYQAEVPLKHKVFFDEFSVSIEGRADGIIREGDKVTIDEIKGVYMDLSFLEEPFVVHKAQAMCYAYIYGIQNHLDTICIQITYGNLKTEDIKRFQEKIEMAELSSWFEGLVREYSKWANYLFYRRIKKEATIKQLEFPFEYRAGQKDMAVSVYRTISRGKTLFVQAPTGIGKTMAAIFPSLKAMGEGFGEKLFYLTAKTITRTVAEDSFELLREKGLSFLTVTITAKNKVCILEEPDCNPISCPYAKGHYDRVNEAVFDIIHETEAIKRETIISYAKAYKVCPHEFCLDITNWVDGIICDYNYVFDPNVRLRRYFSDGIQGDYLFLVDEAHNLVPRAREMYSAKLYKEDFLEAKKLVKNQSKGLTSKIEKCNKAMLLLKRECNNYQVLDSVSHFNMLLMELYGELEVFMQENPEMGAHKELMEFYLAVWNFLNIYERVDNNYKNYTEHTEDGKFMLKLLCVNPAANLRECLEKGRSTIFFSATFLPIQYYKELLRGSMEDYAIYIDSPFHPAHRLLCVGSDVSSKYTRRGPGEYNKIIEYIRAAAESKKGNYIVFFPSYIFLDAIDRILEEYQPRPFEIIRQKTNMTEKGKEEFLLEFEKDRETSMVALCVMGGVFSEGIDLKREKLIGTIIVGTGLPMVSTEGELLKEYFEENNKNGFAFAYLYPGMNKVLQSAGRVIRTAEDYGVILLLDERFLRRDYLNLFPKEWSDYQVVNRNQAKETIETFWRRLQ